jgi:NADH:ubiquinone oxidoreductase subunit 4 (subunit M)
MTEGEVVEQSIEYMGLVVLGMSLIFSVVSAYVVALNYFVGEATFSARFGAYTFVSLILALLLVVIIGAQNTHTGLMERLVELEASGDLTAAGQAVLANSRTGIDDIVRYMVWFGMLAVFVVLAYMTFLHRWKPEVVQVALQSRRAP